MTEDAFCVAGLILAYLISGYLLEGLTGLRCRPGFTLVGRWCFSVQLEPTSMLNSSEICHKQGVHMAVLDSREKEEALVNYIEQMEFFNIPPGRQELYRIAKMEWDVQTEKNKFCEDFKQYGSKSTRYRHIHNAKIPIGSPPHLRANLTTPQGFSLKLSSIPGAGMGAWTDEFVPRYTILGVYEGVIHTRDSDDDLYSWQVDKQGSNGTYVIDAADPSCSNWLRFVNSPTKVSEENVIPVSCEGIIFYMTTRDVEPGTELLVWYGDSYGRFLGVNRIHPEYDLNGSVAFRANVLTFSDNDVLVFDDWTPVTYQNWLENDSEEKDGSVAVDPIFGLLLTYHHDDQWHWVPERNYTYYTGPEGLQLPFFCEDSSYIPEVG